MSKDSPARLREKIKSRDRLQGKQRQWRRWILIGAASKREAAVMRATATMAGRIVGQRRMELTERNI